MANKQATNLGQGIPRLGGELINRLNAVDPGLGTLLASEINHRTGIINSRLAAAAGHTGTVTIATQKRDSTGKAIPSMDIQGGRMVGLTSEPKDGSEPITLEYWRKHEKDCVWFEKMFDECIEEEVKRAAAVPSGIVHAMWGYTYDIPSGSDTSAFDDPGVLELFGGLGAYWQYIVPVTTEVDRLTWWNNELINYGPPDAINWALYEMNTSDTAFSRVAQTGIHLLSSYPLGTNSDMLDSRIVIEPGLYAIALAMPCHKIGGIFPNMLAYRVVNEIKPLPRFGTFVTTDGSMPIELNSSNVIPYTNGETTHDITVVGTVPLAYFDDSVEFSG